jgi:hypothetical protein
VVDWDEGWGLAGRGGRKFLGMMDKFIILIVVMASWVPIYVKTY